MIGACTAQKEWTVWMKILGDDEVSGVSFLFDTVTHSFGCLT